MGMCAPLTYTAAAAVNTVIGLAIRLTFILLVHTAYPEAAANTTKQMLPIGYPEYYCAYPIEHAYAPTSLNRSLLDMSYLKVRELSDCDDNHERTNNSTNTDGHHIRLDYQHKTLQLHLTDQQLVRVTSLKVTQWDRYHLGNVFLAEKPIIRPWLQNAEGLSLLADDRETTVDLGRGSSHTLTVCYYIKLPELPTVRRVTFAFDLYTGCIVEDQQHCGLCHHLVVGANGEPREKSCDGGESDVITQDQWQEMNDTTYRVVTQVLISFQRTSNEGTLYTFMYDKIQGSIVAIRRNIKRNRAQWQLDNGAYDLYGYPVTSTKSANLFLWYENQWQLPHLYPVQAGNVIGDHIDQSYSITVMPFGTMERPQYVLGRVYYVLGNMKVLLVIPMLQSKGGVSLLSEELPSYVVSRSQGDAHVDITIVYRLNLPGNAKREDVRMRFKATGMQVTLKVDTDPTMDGIFVCNKDVILGTESKCVIHQARVVGKPKEMDSVYMFLYDTKTRYLTAVIHANNVEHKVGNDVAIYSHDEEPTCANSVALHIDEHGHLELLQPYAGYASKHMLHDRTRVIVLPKGIKKRETSYATRFKIHGITLVIPYLETEMGVSILDTSYQPNITVESLDGKATIRITYQLKLPEYDTTHKITLEFACKIESAGLLKEKVTVSLISKYQRYKNDGDVCTIDASIWVDTPEFPSENRAVVIGEKGVYVLMTRVLSHANDENKGVLYKFLYSTERSAFFATALPVIRVDKPGGKSCSWVKQGEETRYEYDMGAIVQVEHEIQPHL